MRYLNKFKFYIHIAIASQLEKLLFEKFIKEHGQKKYLDNTTTAFIIQYLLNTASKMLFPNLTFKKGDV